MKLFLKKPLAAFLAVILTLPALPVAHAAIEDALPEIGTTAGGTLSIGQENLMGDFYLRMIRSSSPMVYDPVLLQYVNTLGQKLVANADAVKTPFNFFLIANPNINAFAFFGGNVVLHTSLFRYSLTESELASVMAHEIAHVTQRHLARMMEDQKNKAPLAWAATLGSILLLMTGTPVGAAAMTSTMAGIQQNMISFTQSNEQEADRIGMGTLSRSGFDPQGMPDFMTIMVDMSRYSSKPPEMLLTHPLPDSRLADARNRANQMARKNPPQSFDFLLARARAMSMYGGQPLRNATDQMIDNYSKGNNKEQMAADYARAILLYRDNKYDAASQILTKLLAAEPNNVWFIDVMTDVDIGLNKTQSAVARLESAIKRDPGNPVYRINLGNAYIQNKQYDKATKILRNYTFDYPSDPSGWDLLAEAGGKSGHRADELAARAEYQNLMGDFDGSVRSLTEASRQTKLGSYDQARYDARIDQIRQLQMQFKQFK
ncbi:MAG: M48 family metallopeptidase [Morganella sp. (in: enterobacteria)]